MSASVSNPIAVLARKLLSGLVIFIPVSLVIGCAIYPSAEERRILADKLAVSENWRAVTLSTPGFPLAAYLPQQITHSDLLTIYIEGDGLAWLSRDTPSRDPTPRDPVALRMALAQPYGAAAYLARPCQYLAGNLTDQCKSVYWTNKRFSSEVIEAIDEAVSQLKHRFGAKNIQLVGYSGGGAIALLVAARRVDIAKVISVAGNLDTEEWARHHRVSPLKGSLNPADFTQQLLKIPQNHLVGMQDAIIPPSIAIHFRNRFPASHHPEIVHLKQYNHQCCWAEEWPMLWKSVND